MNDLFITALQNGWRFQTDKGLLSTEQLFQLSDEELDALYTELSNQAQSSGGLLIKHGSSAAGKKAAVVRAVFEAKLAKANKAEEEAKLRSRKEKILEIIAEKQNGALAEKSIEELKAMLND